MPPSPVVKKAAPTATRAPVRRPVVRRKPVAKKAAAKKPAIKATPTAPAVKAGIRGGDF